MTKAALTLVIAISAFAQPAFEVATVKRSPPPEAGKIDTSLGGVRSGVLTFGNASLSDCLRFAYGLVSDAQLSGPDWIKSRDVRFDIVAQIPPATSRSQLLAMLQSLLKERLGLAVHHQRELSHLALTVGKNGPKLREVQPDPAPPSSIFIPGRIVGGQMPMQTLAVFLSRFEREIVIDMTGLKGFYEVKLEWTPDFPPLVNGAPAETAPGPSLFTAVQEQLGLKIESRKGPVDVLVVDHADQIPAEN